MIARAKRYFRPCGFTVAPWFRRLWRVWGLLSWLCTKSLTLSTFSAVRSRTLPGVCSTELAARIIRVYRLCSSFCYNAHYLIAWPRTSLIPVRLLIRMLTFFCYPAWTRTSSAVVWIHPVQCHYDARKSVNCSKSVARRQQNSDLQTESEFLELCKCPHRLNEDDG